MTRRFRSTRKFDKQMKSLEQKTLKQAVKAIKLFMADSSHPSLHFKKIQGTKNFYEIRVNKSIRIIIEVTSQGKDQINTLYIIGTHDKVFPPKA
jgi:mRNA interferase RelE/StbE